MDWHALIKALRIAWRRGYLGWQFAVFSVWFFPLTAAVYAARQGFIWLDRRMYPDWPDTPVEAPLFIVASPRSGTTFLHRLLCLDADRFTSQTLWQTVWPSVSAYRVVRGISALDRQLGGPLARLVAAVERRGFAAWEGIHTTSFGEPEEDEGLWIFSFHTPAVFLLFPVVDGMPELYFTRNLPPATRASLGRDYCDCLRRHIYAEGRGRTMLVKSVFAAARLDILLARFPNARFVHLVRNPFDTFPSTLSMCTRPWQGLYPSLRGESVEAQAFAHLLVKYYQVYMQLKNFLPKDQYYCLSYEALMADPEAAVLAIYDAFGFEVCDAFRERVHDAARAQEGYKSTHHYRLEDFGITQEHLRAELEEAFERFGFDNDADNRPPFPEAGAQGDSDSTVSAAVLRASSRGTTS